MKSDSLGSWLPVFLATAFNFGDTLGRVVSRRIRYQAVHIACFVSLSPTRLGPIYLKTGATFTCGVTLDRNTRGG